MLLLQYRSRSLEWIGTVVVLAAAFRYWLWYFDRSTNLLDEGSTAAQALRILNGDLIYRDFFTVVTPGSYYTVAALFQIFGEQLMVLRWAALWSGLAIVAVTLAIGRQIASWPFAAAAALMTTVWGWFLITPNFYSLQAALFALIALCFFLRDAADPRDAMDRARGRDDRPDRARETERRRLHGDWPAVLDVGLARV